MVSTVQLHSGTAPFVGRVEELAALHGWYREVEAGSARVVLVDGPAGLGKTRLLARFAGELARSGALVLTAASPPMVRVPYLPVLSALMPEVEASDHPAAARLRELIDGPLVDPPNDARVATHELSLYLAISELVVALGDRRPVVLAIDDFHWADDPSIDVLLHLAGALAPTGSRPQTWVMLLLASRPVTATEHAGRALARLRREDHARKLILPGLTELEVNDLLVALGPGRPTPRLLDPLRRVTDGNPLLLRTLWLRLVEEGAIELDGAVAVPRTSIADLVQSSVVLDDELQARLAAASWELREVLEATAINGTAARPDLVATILDRPPAHVTRVVRSHQELGLVELRHGEVSFLHPQMARLVVGELDKADRTRLHARVVEARTALEPGADIALELIDHVLGSGDLIERERRVELLVAAGGRAMRLGAWSSAAAAYEAAADALEDADPRVDEVLWGAALAHFRNHDRRGCQRHAQARAARARQVGDLVAWGEALELLTRIQLTVGAQIVGHRLDDSAIVEFLDEAGQREPKLRARLTGAMAELHFAAFDFDSGLACSEAARAIAADVGDDELTAVTAFTEGIQRLGRLQLREAEACFVTSIDHAERLPDRWLCTWGRGRLPLVLWAQGRFPEAWDAVELALSVAEANHDWAEVSIVHAAATGLATAEGRFDLAERHAADAVRTFDRSEYAYTPGVVYPSLAMARALRADREGAAAAVADWRAQGAVGLASAFDLFIAAAAGDVESSRTLLEGRPWRGRKDQTVDVGRLSFAAGYVDVAALLDEPSIARAVVAVLEAARSRGVRFVIAGGAASVSRLLATAYRLTGDLVTAKERLAEGERHLDGAPSQLGHAELSYERSLVAALEGDAASAATLASDAAASFDQVAAFAGLARAEAVLRRVTRGSVQPVRRTRVIVDTDLVDSTALNAAVGDDRYLELLHEHDRTINDLVRRHAGVPFSHTGDGMLAWFDRGDDAAACALAFQPALDVLNRAHPDHPLRVRCGLAAGEPIADSGNIFGLAVVRAARVCATAGAGEVLASAEVMALATGTRATPYGTVALKGLPEPVSLYSLRDPIGGRAVR